MRRTGFTAALLLIAGLATPQAAHGRNIRPGKEFPSISLPSLDGRVRSVRSFRGRKLILHVFASW